MLTVNNFFATVVPLQNTITPTKFVLLMEACICCVLPTAALTVGLLPARLG